MQILQDKKIVLGVTGGIAAYKTPELVRRLKDHGADVRVVMTDGAKAFITPLTFKRYQETMFQIVYLIAKLSLPWVTLS